MEKREHLKQYVGFPDSSVGKESACNTGDPSLTPGLLRSTEKGVGYPLQDCWASLVNQLVKNPPAMQEMQAQSLGQEDPLGKGLAIYTLVFLDFPCDSAGKEFTCNAGDLHLTWV